MKTSKTVYIIAFLTASAMAYGWGWWATRHSQPDVVYTSVASVYHPIAAEPTDAPPAAPPATEYKRIEGQVWAKADEAARQGLRVSAGPTSKPGEVGLSIIFNGQDPERGVAVVNQLAQSYADAIRAEWKARAQAAWAAAREESRRAREQRSQATSQLEAFQSQQRQAQREAASGPAPSQAQLVDNPQWVDLDRQLAELRRRHDQLLTDRTPEHPEVQLAAMLMADVQKQRDATPRQVPADQVQAVQQRSPAPSTAGPALPTEQADRTVQVLQAAVERASKNCEQVVRIERQAQEAASREPAIELKLAQPTERVAPPDHRIELLLVALLSGLAAFGGLWLVLWWWTSQGSATVDSVAEVRAALGVPVVGVILKDEGRRMKYEGQPINGLAG